MRDRRSTEGLGDVVDVGAKSEPLQHVSNRSNHGIFGFGRRTARKRVGTAAAMASTKAREMTTGGLLGSARKMWLIWARGPYRTGASY